MASLLSRLHVLIIGPGLGREPYMQAFARMALDVAKEQGMFVVVDADGLWMVGQEVSVIKGYRRAVLTPNVVEFKRLSEQAVIFSTFYKYDSKTHRPLTCRVLTQKQNLKSARLACLVPWVV